MKLRGLAALTLAFTLASTIAFAQVSPGTSPLSVPKGGTGAATAAGARSSLQVDRFTGHGDSSYSIAASDRVVGTNATFTASRTWTLPAANAVNAGHTLIVADFASTVTGSNTLVIARAGSDTINGGTSVTINSANGAYLLWSDGASKWSAQAIGASAASGVSSLDGATGAISTQAGSLDVTGSTLSSNVLSSRAFALTQDLSAFSVVKTLGYATAGDGGGATFQKQSVGAALVDYSATALAIATNGTSGCTNGTYRGRSLSTSTGQNLVVTITVSGNVVTAVAITNHGGNKFLAGQTTGSPGPTIPGCAAQPTFTISSVRTPTGSFTDSAGNLWQLVSDADNFINVKQFGAVSNGSTDDFTAVRNALHFAGLAIGNSPDSGGTRGRTVILPQGVTLICGGSTSLLVPYGVHFRGQGAWATNLRICDTMTSSTNVITMCDPEAQLSCFGTLISDMTISQAGTPSASANIAMVFSNAIQQFDALQRVAIYAVNRSCVRYDTGYGGAAYFGMNNIECVIGGTNAGINLSNLGTVIVGIKDSHVESGGSGITANAVQLTGGFLALDNFHTENVSTGVFVNIPTSNANGIVTIRNISGGSNCTNLITRQSGSASNTVIVTSATPNGCTNTVSNAGAGTGSVVIAGQTVY